MVEHYSKHSKSLFDEEMDTMVSINFQRRLNNLGINKSCSCGSGNIVKYGKQKSIQRYKCKDCNKTFTLFSGTIVEKTKYHWDLWVAVLEMTINGFSLDKMQTVLSKDYGCKDINIKTLFLWRHKLIYAISKLEQPKLTGVIQIDETFVREAQKGSRELISYIKEDRKPRYGRRPSKYGVMGPEFATIVCAIDHTNHCVCKVSGLGKLTKEIFVDLFEEHLISPSYICTDANSVYDDYCSLFDIPHYERPSNYLTIIEKNGYETPDWTNPTLAKKTEKENYKILEKLYYLNMIDKITNRGEIDFKKFNELKNANSLSLARVNELHSRIKNFINYEMKNVSTKYLNTYIGFFSYIQNWKVDKGKYPSSKRDCEKIFVEILKTKVNFTITDIDKAKLKLNKPSDRYVKILKENTEKIRALSKNKYFKFDEEDNVISFNKREYLLDQPKSRLHKVCKEYKLKKYSKLAKWSLVSEILKLPDVEDIVFNLILSDRHYHISDEDLEVIRSLSHKY